MEKHATRPWGAKSESKSAGFGVAATNGSSAFEGLPEPFIAGLRTLFDVMDDTGSGYVRLAEIEKRWRKDEEVDSDAEQEGLPRGVIECLRKVTPPNGKLSFERFCAGLKICLLRDRARRNQQQDHQKQAQVQKERKKQQPLRPPSAPNLEGPRVSGDKKTPGKIVNMATVRPNNVGVHSPSRSRLRTAVSMPHLLDDEEDEDSSQQRNEGTKNGLDLAQQKSVASLAPGNAKSGLTAVPLGPPKPPRVAVASAASSRAAKSEIRAALHCWHMGLLHSDSESVKSGSDFELSAIAESAQQAREVKGRITLSANSVSLNNLSWETGHGSGSGTIVSYLQAGLEGASPLRRSTNRRREPRRHTLQSGIDYNMLKRLKQVEQEREMIVLGLQTLEKAKDWYLGQLAIVEEKMRDVGQNGQLWEHSSEAHQERLNFQRARITEVNQHLIALIESSEKGFPLHMNLALRMPSAQDSSGGQFLALNSAHSQMQINNRSILRLKDQNRQLTEEVGKKSERITALEREKAVLIRELFQARSMLRRGPSTVMPAHGQQQISRLTPTAGLHSGVHQRRPGAGSDESAFL